jgi:hypothetical protein
VMSSLHNQVVKEGVVMVTDCLDNGGLWPASTRWMHANGGFMVYQFQLKNTDSDKVQ